MSNDATYAWGTSTRSFLASIDVHLFSHFSTSLTVAGIVVRVSNGMLANDTGSSATSVCCTGTFMAATID